MCWPQSLFSGEQLTLVLAGIAGVVWLVRLEGRVNEAHRICADMKLALAELGDIDVRVARVETKIDGLFEQMRDLNSQLRWMAKPADYKDITRPVK